MPVCLSTVIQNGKTLIFISISAVFRYMKAALSFLILILFVFLAGCTGTAPAQTTPSLPNLTGTWSGPMEGYDEGTGFTDYRDLALAMVVEEQHGRLFSGYFRLTSNSTVSDLYFAGAVGRDNKTLTITEREGGYCLGEVLGPDEIELTYMQDGSPYSIAIDHLKRK